MSDSDPVVPNEADVPLVAMPVLLSFFSLVGAAWVIARRHSEVVGKRGWQFVLLGLFACNLGFWVDGFRITSSLAPDLNCYVSIWLAAFEIPMWLSPYIIRALLLDLNYRWNLKKLRPKEVNDRDFWFKKYPVLTSNWFYYSMLGVTFVVNCLIAAGITFVNENPDECDLDHLNIMHGSWALLLLALACFYVFRLKQTKDSYGLRLELMVFMVIFPVGFLAILLVELLTTSDLAHFLIFFFCALGSLAVSVFYPVYLSYRPEWRGKSLRGSEAGDLHKMNTTELFHYCLTHPQLLVSFKQYCVELWCAENILFYLEVQAFKQLFEDGSGVDPKVRAHALVEQFVEANSPSVINIDDSTRRAILEQLAKGEVTMTLFDGAEKTVEQQMRQDTFSKFKLSRRLDAAWKNAGLGDLADVLERDGSTKQLPLGGGGGLGGGTGGTGLTSKEKDGTVRMSDTAMELLRSSEDQVEQPLP